MQKQIDEIMDKLLIYKTMGWSLERQDQQQALLFLVGFDEFTYKGETYMFVRDMLYAVRLWKQVGW